MICVLLFLNVFKLYTYEFAESISFRSVSDCGMVASRLQVNLDDLLWVLTDSQLNAAMVFLNSLKDVIKKSSQQSKQLAAEKLKVSSKS